MSVLRFGMDRGPVRARVLRNSARCLGALALFAVLLYGTQAWGYFQSFDFRQASLESAAGPASVRTPGVVRGSVHALRLQPHESVSLDGRLDDAVWGLAEAAGGFHVWNPDRGAPGHETTLFKVAYDENAIYFGIACAEHDAGEISKMLSRRDRESDSDWVRFYVDPYHDRSTGYYFAVNPLGVQIDGYVYNDGDEDQDWDAVWEAETYEDADGWYAELRIPFSSISYRSGATTWGLDVFRDIHRLGQTDAWVVWDRETAGFVSRFGQITGLRNIPAPRQLEVLPYAVFRSTDPAQAGPEARDRFENFGADLKYGVSSNLVLNATVQPDFGQVEADPAVLNLSPFETFYQEKRPFFMEGNRYFQQPAFNLFYSRRIGTGSETSRIRAAGKLTGKTTDGVSIGVLGATTDVTEPGQAHNLLKGGSRQANCFVARLGKEYSGGNYRFNVMQTAISRPGSRDVYGDMGSREAYTTGADFRLRFLNRRYTFSGSFAGSIIDPEGRSSDPGFSPAKSYGTAGYLELFREAGTWRGSANGTWIGDRFDVNDLGYLRAPDALAGNLWVQYRINGENHSRFIRSGNVNYNLNLGWTYAGRTGYDLHTGEEIWHYGRGHRTISSSNVNWWTQFRNFYAAWGGVSRQFEGTQRYDTRSTVLMSDGSRAAIPGGGPLLGEPSTWTAWLGTGTNDRKRLVASTEYTYSFDWAHNLSRNIDLDLSWNQSNALHHELSLGFQNRSDDTQHLENFENLDGGIGGVSYVYGQLRQKTLSATWRTSLLFSRSRSLEVYAQPYLTTGTYKDPREVGRPDTYELIPYTAEGFDVRDYDFRYGAVNLNMVYRWEYRPGSTLFLVWTHSRSTYDERGSFQDPAAFKATLSADPLFRNEPENVFLAKVTYWLPI